MFPFFDLPERRLVCKTVEAPAAFIINTKTETFHEEVRVTSELFLKTSADAELSAAGLCPEECVCNNEQTRLQVLSFML